MFPVLASAGSTEKKAKQQKQKKRTKLEKMKNCNKEINKQK